VRVIPPIQHAAPSTVTRSPEHTQRHVHRPLELCHACDSHAHVHAHAYVHARVSRTVRRTQSHTRAIALAHALVLAKYICTPPVRTTANVFFMTRETLVRLGSVQLTQPGVLVLLGIRTCFTNDVQVVHMIVFRVVLVVVVDDVVVDDDDDDDDNDDDDDVVVVVAAAVPGHLFLFWFWFSLLVVVVIIGHFLRINDGLISILVAAPVTVFCLRCTFLFHVERVLAAANLDLVLNPDHDKGVRVSGTGPIV
jgi:hypothetical protein